VSRRLPTSPLASVLVLVLLASGFLTLLTMPAAAFGEKPYESNTVIADSFHLNVYSGQSVAQSFLATASYRLLNTTLRLRNTGDTSDVISITIRPDAGGVPSTNVMASSPIVIGNNSLITLGFELSQYGSGKVEIEWICWDGNVHHRNRTLAGLVNLVVATHAKSPDQDPIATADTAMLELQPAPF